LWRQCQGEERFILGEHYQRRLGASACWRREDGLLRWPGQICSLWDLESRRQIGLLPHAEEVIGAAASSNGRWLATATMKGG